MMPNQTNSAYAEYCAANLRRWAQKGEVLALANAVADQTHKQKE